MHKFAVSVFFISVSLLAQQPSFNFVAPTTRGKVTLPPQGGAWQPAEAALYDEGTRPALQYKDTARNIALSVILFPNQTGASTGEACRDSLIPRLMATLREHNAVLEDEAQSVGPRGAAPLAIASYTIAKQGTFPLQQRNVFVFAGDAHTCAELHLSKVTATKDDKKVLDEIASHFAFDLSYKPIAQDYETMGVIFFQGAKNFAASAIYYQRAYDELPPDQRKTKMSRYVADQLTMSYGMSGDLTRSRATAEAAIAVDPTYPLYYYNLACADAESGDAKAAATHLQQAFERRAKTLEGEPFPNPTQDDSLQKLKTDKPFWDLATKISAQLKKMNLTINTERLMRELNHLASLTDCPPTGDISLPSPTQAVTRIVFTPRDLEARIWLMKLAQDAGFIIREDAVGNTFIRWQGSDARLGAVGTGSHTDAIPHAGMYDGTVGVLGGLEAIRSLKESGFQPKRSLELLMFTSEEPTRFGIGCLGSRLLGGVFDPQAADALIDRLPETDKSAATGLTLRDAREAAGFRGPLDSVPLPKDYHSAWLELHIEQGPLLEREGMSLGIVTGIAAPASYRYTVEGFGGHAGALLMPDRRDALCAAAEMILSVEQHARQANESADGIDTVATVGMVDVHPGAINSVPSRVTLTLDIRDTDVTRRNNVMTAFQSDIARIEHTRSVKISEELINADAPAQSDPRILETLERVCKAEGVGCKKMVSRAYHDSSFIAAIAPIAMLFIPCRNGVSHRPDEYASPESIGLGTRVLALTMAQLANE